MVWHNDILLVICLCFCIQLMSQDLKLYWILFFQIQPELELVWIYSCIWLGLQTLT